MNVKGIVKITVAGLVLVTVAGGMAAGAVASGAADILDTPEAAESADETTLDDAWFGMSRAERKAACKNPYAGAINLGSGGNAAEALTFLRLICN